MFSLYVWPIRNVFVRGSVDAIDRRGGNLALAKPGRGLGESEPETVSRLGITQIGAGDNLQHRPCQTICTCIVLEPSAMQCFFVWDGGVGEGLCVCVCVCVC